jgi:hypothetical protein
MLLVFFKYVPVGMFNSFVFGYGMGKESWSNETSSIY